MASKNEPPRSKLRGGSFFTVPGVIIGGQLGPLVSSRMLQHTLERMLAILFILVAILTLGEVIF